MAEEYDDEKFGVAVLDMPIALSEKILESKRLANLLIIALILLTAFAMLGIGYLTTYPFAPASAAQVSKSATP